MKSLKKGFTFLLAILFLSLAPTAIHAQELKNPVASLKLATKDLSNHFLAQQENHSTQMKTADEQNKLKALIEDYKVSKENEAKVHSNFPVSHVLSATTQILQKLNPNSVEKSDTKAPENTSPASLEDNEGSKVQGNEVQAQKENQNDLTFHQKQTSSVNETTKPSRSVNLNYSSDKSITDTSSLPSINLNKDKQSVLDGSLLNIGLNLPEINNTTLRLNVGSQQNLLAVNTAIGEAALGLNVGSQQNLLAVNAAIGEATLGLNVGSQQNLLAVNAAIGEAALGLNVGSQQNLLAVNAAIGEAALGLNVGSQQNLLAVNAAIGEAALGLSLMDANKGLIGLQIPIIDVKPIKVGPPIDNGYSENSNSPVSSGDSGINSNQTVEVQLPAVSGLENANKNDLSMLFIPGPLSNTETDDPVADGTVLPILSKNTDDNLILTSEKGLEAKLMDPFMDRGYHLTLNLVHNQTELEQRKSQQENDTVNGTLENELGYLSSTGGDSSNGNSGSSSGGGAGVNAILGFDCQDSMGLRSQLQFFLKELADKWIKVPPTMPPKTTFFLYV